MHFAHPAEHPELSSCSSNPPCHAVTLDNAATMESNRDTMESMESSGEPLASPAQPAPHKFSRYRSVRRAAVPKEQPPPLPLPFQYPAAGPPQSIQHSKSRYHKRPVSIHADSHPPPQPTSQSKSLPERIIPSRSASLAARAREGPTKSGNAEPL